MRISTEKNDIDPDLISGEVIFWYVQPKTCNIFQSILQWTKIDIILGRIKQQHLETEQDMIVCLRQTRKNIPILRYEQYASYHWRFYHEQKLRRAEKI